MLDLWTTSLAYVALSRATCLEGLEIHNFDPGKVQAHPRVLAWHTTWLPQASGSATRLSCGFDEDEMDSEEGEAGCCDDVGMLW